MFYYVLFSRHSRTTRVEDNGRYIVYVHIHVKKEFLSRLSYV